MNYYPERGACDRSGAPGIKKPLLVLRFIDLTLPTPEENLALDEALLLALEEAARTGSRPEEALRFWESPVHFVALGAGGRLREEVDLEACSLLGVQILRRASGGGTVLQGSGCLNFTLVLSLDARAELRDVRRSYRTILGCAAEALRLGAEVRGTSDLALEGRKVSGNAQKRTRHALLHQGTILWGLDIGLMARVLCEPEKQPAYRRGRSHAEFVQNVPLPAAEIKSRLATAWGSTKPDGQFELPEIRRLVTEKYGNREWTERL